jgi:carbonic anhydrase/acetyltransferase-like protein (isoleucine patch superfamily)
MVHADPGFPATIVADVTIGHRAIVHGCTICPRTLVGMGATIVNGAVIGSDCLIGAGSLITEGKEIFGTIGAQLRCGKRIRASPDQSASYPAAAK